MNSRKYRFVIKSPISGTPSSPGTPESFFRFLGDQVAVCRGWSPPPALPTHRTRCPCICRLYPPPALLSIFCPGSKSNHYLWCSSSEQERRCWWRQLIRGLKIHATILFGFSLWFFCCSFSFRVCYCSHKNCRERAAMMESNSEISCKVPVNSFLETIVAEIDIM